MKYLLDSNICIHFLRGKYRVNEKLGKIGFNDCAISEITLAELVYGAENSDNPDRSNEIVDRFVSQLKIIPIFDCISLYGKEKTKLRKSGILISDFDLLIGCTAVEKGLIMVTENVREFERISNIKIENWIQR